MSSGSLHLSRAQRIKLSLIVVAPGLVAILALLAPTAQRLGLTGEADPAARVASVVEHSAGLFREAAAITSAGLARYPDPPTLPERTSRLARRLEGVGVLSPEGEFLVWSGVPPELSETAFENELPAWYVGVDGARTRLVVLTARDDAGRFAISSFVLDSAVDNWVFEDLLPSHEMRGVRVAVTFFDTVGAQPAFGTLDHPRDASVAPLASPSGKLLGEAAVEAVSGPRRAERQRRAGLAWAAVLAACLTAALLPWRDLNQTAGGLILLGFVVIGVRLLLWLADAPGLLLPRDYGGAGLYGSDLARGLLASPADLLLSGLAAYLLSRIARSTMGALRPRFARTLSALLSVPFLLMAVGVTHTFATSCRVPVLDGPGFWRFDERSLLALGLVMFLLAAAEVLALVATRRWSGDLSRAFYRNRLAVLLILVASAGICSAYLQRESEVMTIERLGAEIVPEVRDPSRPRSRAVSATVRSVIGFLQEERQLLPASSRYAYAAYYFWASGELFHRGYKSAIYLYNLSGGLMSRFSFGLPVFHGSIPPPTDADVSLTVRSRTFRPGLAIEQKMIHAEMPILIDGEVRGLVVGLVLDEPENLTFLPLAGPYRAALGQGSPARLGKEFRDGIHYVLYDQRGTVLLTTIAQPPALGELTLPDGDEPSAVRVRTEDEVLFGLALGTPDRYHLLLVPGRGPLERTARWIRLAAFAFGMMVLLALVRRLLRPGGIWQLAGEIRRSFHRKLLVALLVASVVPLVGLATFLEASLERRGTEDVRQAARQSVATARRVVEDYLGRFESAANEEVLNDEILYWLRGMVQQDIHIYERGRKLASSRNELFESGLLLPRLDGAAQRGLLDEGVPSLVLRSALGSNEILVAYAPVRNVDPDRQLIVAVPVAAGLAEVTRAVGRISEVILITTVALLALLAVAATYLARTVSRPVQELVGATGQIASGDFDARLVPRTEDEMAQLVRGFNTMASALSAQRSDLERRREYIETLLRHATTGVISTDPEGRIVTLNPTARALLTEARPAVGGSLAEALRAVKDLEPLADAVDGRMRASGEPQEVDLGGDDEARRFRVVRIELPDTRGGSVGRLVLLDDVTDLMRSNQLAAWAEMARAIAHEIKNPLTPIQLSTEHLHRLLRDAGVCPSPEIDRCIETIMKQVRTLYEIAREFSAYSKLPAMTPEPADAVAFMRDTLGPYRSSGERNIRIVERFADGGQVSIDVRVMQRAVVNLVENALHAMPHGGTLTVSVERASDDREIVLGVTDTGTGLDPEARRRLFEPYFSTKSSGTGLGLAIVRRAVEAHHGTIEVQSRIDEGTTFRIRLPAHSVPVA